MCLLSFEILYSTCERLVLFPVSNLRQTGSKLASKIMPMFQQLSSTRPILYLTFRWAIGIAASSQCLQKPRSRSHLGLSSAITQIKLQSVRWFQLLFLLLFAWGRTIVVGKSTWSLLQLSQLAGFRGASLGSALFRLQQSEYQKLVRADVSWSKYCSHSSLKISGSNLEKLESSPLLDVWVCLNAWPCHIQLTK